MGLSGTRLILSLVLIIFFSLDNSTNNWILKKNENGIAVYTKNNESYKIKEVRIIDTVKSSFSGIVAVLLDTKNYPTWIYRCGEGKTLKLITEQEQYDYELTNLPWPFDNRDVTTYSTISQNTLTKMVTINSIAVPDFIAERDGVVRIKRFKSIYKLTKLANGTVKIDYELYADPGGDIPAWLINANIVTGPYNSTLEMNKQLPHYQSASYSFIKE